MSNPWFVYILRCADGTYYTGISNDIQARLARHNSGNGASYVRSRRPAILVWWEYAGTCGAALKREAAIKGYGREAKERLVRGEPLAGARGGPRPGVCGSFQQARLFHW
jgi:predicted GIY-YIG superfamily endonuclease